MTVQQTDFDVIIIGAGPAGLSVGSELSQQLKILIVDKKEQVSDCHRSWLVPDLCIEDGQAQEIISCAHNGVTRFLTKTFGGAHVSWQANLKYYFIDEHKVLPLWANKIEKSGSKILLNCYYQDSEVLKDKVKVQTSEGIFTTRLLIDASGYNSPIRQKYSIENPEYYWWSVYGVIVELPDGLDKMEVGDYMLWQTFADSNLDKEASLAHGRPILEYEILDENTAFVFVFYLQRKQVEQDLMHKEFNQILRDEASTRNFHNCTIKEWKYGWYPLGGSNSQKIAQDRVAFIGDAACWTTPCGWGFSYIVNNYKFYAQRLLENIQQEKLKKEQLSKIINLSVRSKSQLLMDQIATHFLANASSSLLDQFINMFTPGGPLGDDGPLLCEKLFTLTLDDNDVKTMLKAAIKYFDMKELMHIMPFEDYLLLLEEVKEFLEYEAIEKLHKLLHVFHKKTPDDEQTGFDFNKAEVS
ncbi:MAG: FAD-dependent monooxygenase [Pseudomonadota bacterium]